MAVYYDTTAKRRYRQTLMFIGALVSVCGFGYLDYLEKLHLSLMVFYLIPISYVTWYLSRTAAYSMVIMSGLISFWSDVASNGGTQHPFVPYWELGTHLVFFFFVVYLLNRLRKTLEREKINARMDYVSAVANQRHFFEYAETKIKKRKQADDHLTLVYLDVDNFKRFNDTNGHTTGDSLLRTVGTTMRESLRMQDIVARFGGDEFVILLPGTDYTSAKTIVHRLQACLLRSVNTQGWNVTFSIGAVTCTLPQCSFTLLLEKADKLMYAVKKNGKNKVRHEILQKPDIRPTTVTVGS